MIALWLFTVVRSMCHNNAPCAYPRCSATVFSNCYCGSSSNLCNSNQYCNGGRIFHVCSSGLARVSCMCNSSFCNKGQYCNGGIVSSGIVSSGPSIVGCTGGGCGSSIVVSTGCNGGGCGCKGGGCGNYIQICKMKCQKYMVVWNVNFKKHGQCLHDCYDMSSSSESDDADDSKDDSYAQESSDDSDDAKEERSPRGQGMPPQGMPPQGMPPHGMPPQGMHHPPPRGPTPREEEGSQMPMILLAGSVVLVLMICLCAAVGATFLRSGNNAGDADSGVRYYEASAAARRSLAVEQARASKAREVLAGSRPIPPRKNGFGAPGDFSNSFRINELTASRMTRPAGSVAQPTGSFAQPAGSFARPAGSFAQPTGSFARPAGSFARPAGNKRYGQPKKSGVSITSLVLGRNSNFSSKRNGNKERRGKSNSARNERTGRSSSRREGRTSVKK